MLRNLKKVSLTLVYAIKGTTQLSFISNKTFARKRAPISKSPDMSSIEKSELVTE